MNAAPLTFSARVGFAVDRAISLLAPGYGYSRMEARHRVEDLNRRMYAAAKPTGDSGGWIPYDGDVNSLVRNSSQMVRARVRQLVRDFPYAKRAIKLRTALVIGNGIRLQARLRKADGTLDQDANKIFESAFARWAEQADVSGKLSFVDLLNLAERQNFECGEYFFIKRYLRGQKNPFRLQPVEADRLSAYGVKLAPGCDIESGIEYEKLTGRPIAYHFSDDGYSVKGHSAKTIRVPADMVIHGYEVERPGQMRGISPMASSVMVAGNLADLLEAELEAMRMASRYLAFVHSSGIGDTQSITPGGKGKGKKANVEHFDHATIQYLRNGEEVTLAKVDRQSGTFEPYVKFNIRTFAVGTGLTYELVSGDYDHISYSNLRGIRLDLNMTVRPIQRNHINWLCNPAAAGWLGSAILTDPSLMPLARRITPASYTWIASGMDSPDPLKEIKAFADEVKQGVSSPQELCARKGRVHSEVLDEIAESKKMAEERGLTLGDVVTSLKGNPAALMEEKDNA